MELSEEELQIIHNALIGHIIDYSKFGSQKFPGYELTECVIKLNNYISSILELDEKIKKELKGE